MRFLILAAAATLFVTGTANAAQHHRYHHHATAEAPVANGAVPADVLSTHDLYIRNVREAGYDHQVK